MFFPNLWFICPHFEEKGLFKGTKVHFTKCFHCEFHFCKFKTSLFSYFFPEWISKEAKQINKKIVLMNENKLAKKQYGPSSRYCPIKNNASTKCSGRNKFCKYNIVCGKYKESERTAKFFIKSIRWRKKMIYVVEFTDGRIEYVDKKDFVSVNIDDVKKVYSGNYEVIIVKELVPLGEEEKNLKETIEIFKEKYTTEIITQRGPLNFEEWFESSLSGSSAIIPEKILVPQKTYKVVRIKDDFFNKNKELEKKESLLNSKTNKDLEKKSVTKKSTKQIEKSEIQLPFANEIVSVDENKTKPKTKRKKKKEKQ